MAIKIVTCDTTGTKVEFGSGIDQVAIIDKMILTLFNSSAANQQFVAIGKDSEEVVTSVTEDGLTKKTWLIATIAKATATYAPVNEDVQIIDLRDEPEDDRIVRRYLYLKASVDVDNVVIIFYHYKKMDNRHAAVLDLIKA